MRLRAQIVIDIEARDFSDAASHEEKVAQIYDLVREQYGQAHLEFRQRRQRPRRLGEQTQQVRHYTGRMADYEE
jgi:hypothetical protein